MHMVTKLTALLQKNNLLQNEIRQLRETLNVYEEKQQRLLERVEELEKDPNTRTEVNHRSNPNDVHALLGSVADELEARRNKEMIVIYGLSELGTDIASEQEEIQAVATILDEGGWVGESGL